MAQPKKVLVTGGCGFIGSHTVVSLIENNFEPVIVDTLENSEKFILHNIEKITGKKVKFHQVDCSDRGAMKKIFSEEKFQGIIHFAAYKAVGESVQQPLKYYHNNIASLVVLLELCQQYQVHELIFSSSCTVYGSPDEVQVTEQSPMGVAESPYGFTKQIGERIIRDFSLAWPAFKAVMLRYFNPIGAHPLALLGELPIGSPNNLVPYITQTAIGKRQQLIIFGNDYPTADGTCIRDFIHVCDIADAHVEALKKINQMKKYPEVFNLGTGYGHSVLEVVKTFEEVSGQKLNYTIGPRRSGDVVSIFANTEKAAFELDWHTRYTLADALKHAWEWEKTYEKFRN